MSNLRELMSALADGELHGEELAAAELEASNSPVARAELAWCRALKSAVQTRCENPRNEDGWQACRARLDAIDKTKTTEAFVGRYAWGLCAIFFVAIVSAAALNRAGSTRTLPTSQVAGLFTGLNPLAVAEPAEAEGVVREAVGLAPNRISSMRCKVASLATGTVDGKRAARLCLVDGRGRVTLMVIAGTNKVEGVAGRCGEYAAGVINGRQAIAWVDSGYLLMVTGDRPQAELCAVANALRGVE